MTNSGVTRMRWPDATAAGGSVREQWASLYASLAGVGYLFMSDLRT